MNRPSPASETRRARRGSASYLSKLFRLPVPTWTADRRRVLDEPWFTGVSDAPGMREYLTVSSPAEFRCRNIFTEERPLRRAIGAGAARCPGDRGSQFHPAEPI